MWQQQLPALNNNSVPDGFGGLLVTEHQTCNPGQTDAMAIVDLDPITGKPLWQITAQPVQGFNRPVYCYPVAPQFAIRPDGSVVISAPGNTAGLPELAIVNGQTGSGGSIFIPPSSYTATDGTVSQGYSPIGSPIVSSDGSAYVEYEVRTIGYPVQVTSAMLYLLQIAPDNSTTTTMLSSTTKDENLFPGQIIPDGQGGVLATWTIETNTPPTVPQFPYQAVDVVSGALGPIYNLPFSPQSLPLGSNDSPLSPILVLGQNSTAFAANGAQIDPNNPQSGTTIASFNPASGAINWNYTGTPQTTLTMMAVLSDGTLAINDSVYGIYQIGTNGSATKVLGTIGGIAQYSWGGNWYVQGSQAASGIVLPLDVDPAGIWATPNGNPSKNATPDALCECLLQSNASGQGSSALTGDIVQSQDRGNSIQPASIPNCPICNLPEPTQQPNCTSLAGSGPAYLILVGDPGDGIHNQGNNFNLAAQTEANYRQSQGNNVIACRVASVQHVVTALTGNGVIAGGVIYFGHSGSYLDTSINGSISILEVGQGTGANTNVSFKNVSQLSAVLTANQGTNIIGTKASILLNGCRAGLTLYDSYALYETSIAQLIANKTQRGVYAYDKGIYFSINDAAHATSSSWLGEPNPLPASLPLYMIPDGRPGRKKPPLPFTPQ